MGKWHLVYVLSTDWFPTILRAAGTNTSGTFPLDGVDQWGALRATDPNPDSPRTELLINIDPINRSSALRKNHWKIIRGEPLYSGWYPPPESGLGPTPSPAVPHITLYNITADPREKRNLADSYPNVVSNLLARLNDYGSEQVDPWVPPVDPASNPDNFGGVWQPWRD
eukprot:TRINITY_DN3156_c1_g2_i1.p1 TRINITY_DN3156_c1_g2~~TRINITY_DN3156_c1_g2_i1.p1  ORF type:complete len:168 (-),score=22.59 TRINITY_DN3156_c1_g2_i1:55-558(-)